MEISTLPLHGWPADRPNLITLLRTCSGSMRPPEAHAAHAVPEALLAPAQTPRGPFYVKSPRKRSRRLCTPPPHPAELLPGHGPRVRREPGAPCAGRPCLSSAFPPFR